MNDAAEPARTLEELEALLDLAVREHGADSRSARWVREAIERQRQAGARDAGHPRSASGPC